MAITKKQFIEWAIENGWEQDRFGNMQKEVSGTAEFTIQRFRLKFTKLVVRKEVRSGERWIRLKSGYFGEMTITDGRLEGMKR